MLYSFIVKPGALFPLTESVLMLAGRQGQIVPEEIFGGDKSVLIGFGVDGLGAELDGFPLRVGEGAGQVDGVVDRTSDRDGHSLTSGGSHCGSSSRLGDVVTVVRNAGYSPTAQKGKRKEEFNSKTAIMYKRRSVRRDAEKFRTGSEKKWPPAHGR